MDEKLYDTELISKISRGNPNFIRQMLVVFTEDVPKSLDLIKHGIAENDHETIMRQAHSLKSSIDLLNISPSKSIVRQIEEYARAKDEIERIESLYLTMERDILTVIESINKDLTA